MDEQTLRKIVKEVVDVALEPIKRDLSEVKDTQETRVLPSVVTTENTIKVYSDMYKLNNDNMKKLEKRIETLEDEVGIQPSPELVLAEIH